MNDAKEKAKELVDKFIPHTKVFHEGLGWEEYQDSAKQCALIAVDEVLHYSKAHGFIELTDHLEEVKTEIEKL